MAFYARAKPANYLIGRGKRAIVIKFSFPI